MYQRRHQRHSSHLFRDLVLLVLFIIISFILIGAYHNGQWSFYRNNVTKHVIKSRKPKVKEITRTRVKRVTKKVFIHLKKSKSPNLLSANQAQTKVSNLWNNVDNAMKSNHGNYGNQLDKYFNGQGSNSSSTHLFNWMNKTKDKISSKDSKFISLNASNFNTTKKRTKAIVHCNVTSKYKWLHAFPGTINGDVKGIHNTYSSQTISNGYIITVNLKNGKIMQIKQM